MAQLSCILKGRTIATMLLITLFTIFIVIVILYISPSVNVKASLNINCLIRQC